MDKMSPEKGDIIEKANNELISLCDEYFLEYYIQQYAGANHECMYCGAYQGKSHTSLCPITIYKGIKEKLK